LVVVRRILDVERLEPGRVVERTDHRGTDLHDTSFSRFQSQDR
jgi:hypothetical protein